MPEQVEPTLGPTKTTIVITSIPTQVVTVDANASKFSWKRVNSGKQFERENIISMAIYSKDSSILYAATENAGIYKTIDGGKSWSPSLTGLEETSFKTILVEDSNPQSVLALSNGGTVYSSQDGGERWDVLLPATDFLTDLLIQDPSEGQHLLSWQNQTLAESQDFGRTWMPIATPVCPSNIYDLEIDALNNKELTAIQESWVSNSCPAGVYRSLDGGRNWAISGLEVPNLMLLDVSSDYIYVVTGASAEVYISPDRGQTWRGPISPNGERCVALSIDPQSGEKAFCLLLSNHGEQVEVWKTLDAGNTWSKSAGLGIYGTSIEITSFSPEKFFVIGRGLEVSSDGGQTWNSKQNGLGSRTFELAFDPTNSGILYAHESRCQFNYSKLFKSSDAGTTLELMTGAGTSSFCGLSFGYGGILYRWQFWDYITSTDHGKTWKLLTKTIQPEFITGMGGNPKVEGLILSTLRGMDSIFRTIDDGLNWNSTTKSSGSHDNFYFVGEEGKQVYATTLSSISRSDDSGASWMDCALPSVKLAESGTNLAVNPNDVNKIYIATQGEGVLVSKDGCSSFQAINSGLKDLFVNTVAVDPNNPTKLIAGTSGGAYLSLDQGDSWFRVNDGLLGATIIYSIAINPADSNVYAATPYGVFKLIEQD